MQRYASVLFQFVEIRIVGKTTQHSILITSRELEGYKRFLHYLVSPWSGIKYLVMTKDLPIVLRDIARLSKDAPSYISQMVRDNFDVYIIYDHDGLIIPGILDSTN